MTIRRALVLLAILAFGAAAAASFGEAPPPAHASGTVDIAAGSFHGCSVTSTGGVKCWGHNGSGQVGDGTTTTRPTPVAIGVTLAEQVEGGQSHTCAITYATGQIDCWGANYSGQLGDGTTTQRNSPVPAIGFAEGFVFEDLALGMAHSCAVTDAGNVLCWGQGTGGQLGNGNTANATDPVYVCAVGTTAPCSPGNSNILGNVIDIEAGWKHVCAHTASGGSTGVVCWGWNSFGQIGDNQACGSGACSVPVNVCADATCASSLSGVHDISAGGLSITGFSCAALTSGNVKCWGDNGEGQLGDQSQTQRNAPVYVCASTSTTGPCSPEESDALTGIGAVTGGGDVFSAHSCAIAPAYNTVKCWGSTLSGQLGDGLQCGSSTGYCPAPVDVCGKNATAPCSFADQDLLGDVAEVDAGGVHTCALTNQGAAGCWGDNTYGSLGNGTTTSSSKPVDVQLWTQATSIDLGGSGCALKTSDGTVQCWGPGSDGQLGNGGTNLSPSPVTVTGITGATSISAGDAHACAVVGGAAKCWGDNAYGQLGVGDTTDRSTPVTVSGLSSGVASISAGGRHTCAVTTSNIIKCWGNNTNGQLGDGTTTQRTTPVQVAIITYATSVAAGSQHTCAVQSGGTSSIRCWGLGTSGQLGQGQTQSSVWPINVNHTALGGTAFIISAGSNHTCATVGLSGAIKCWGLGTSGQLGVGNTTSYTLPQQVSGFTSSSGVIAAGGNHTCAQAGSNTVKCWGNNAYGQIGDGTVTNRTLPTAVPNFNTVQHLGAGLNHTCAKVTGSGIKCWGINTSGEVGMGSTSSFEYAPTDVVQYAAKPLPSCGPGGSAGDLVLMIGAMMGIVAFGARRRLRLPLR
jgi:alpha-tubulin suppressor-like RCC1 family protein